MTTFEFLALRKGAPLCRLAVPSGDTPGISWQADAEIMRSLSVTCVPDSRVDWLTDVLAVVQRTNGREIPLGRFWVTTSPTHTNNTGRKVWQLTGYDGRYLLKISRLERVRTLAAGSNVVRLIYGLLVEAGVDRILAAESSEVLMTDHEYEAGTSLLTICDALCSEINYDPVWFDGEGAARLRPWTPPRMATAAHRYRTGEASVMMTPMDQDEDVYEAANVFVGICASADLPQTLRAEAVNNDPISPLSVMRRGRRVPDVETVDSIASLEALQTREDNRKIMAMMGAQKVQWQTAVAAETAQHGLFDGVILERDGIGLLQETDWSLELRPAGLMSHTGRRVYFD